MFCWSQLRFGYNLKWSNYNLLYHVHHFSDQTTFLYFIIVLKILSDSSVLHFAHNDIFVVIKIILNTQFEFSENKFKIFLYPYLTYIFIIIRIHSFIRILCVSSWINMNFDFSLYTTVSFVCLLKELTWNLDVASKACVAEANMLNS